MNDKWFLGARRVFFALFACWVTLPAFATHRALVEETADAVKVGNGSVELIVPKGKAFNIQSMKLNDGEEMVVPSTNAIPWVLTYKGIRARSRIIVDRIAMHFQSSTETRVSVLIRSFRVIQWRLVDTEPVDTLIRIGQ